MTKIKKIEILIIFVSLLLAFLIRLPVLMKRTYEPIFDRNYYISMMQGFIHGDIKKFLGISLKPILHYPPFYPFLGALCSLFVKGWRALLLGSILSIVIFYYFFYKITKRLLGFRTALIFFIISILYPPFVRISTEIYSEPLYYMFVSCLIYFLLSSHSRMKNIVIAGIIGACATLTRVEGIVFFLIGNLYIWIFLRRWKMSLIYSLSFFLIIGAYLLTVHSFTGKYLFTGRGINFEVSEHKVIRNIDIGLGVAKEEVRLSLGHAVKYYLISLFRRIWHTFHLYIKKVVYPEILIFYGIGIFSLLNFSKRNKCFFVFIIIPLIMWFFHISVHRVQERYLIQVLPFVLSISSYGIIKITDRIKRRLSFKSLVITIFLIIAIYSIDNYYILKYRFEMAKKINNVISLKIENSFLLF